jgi:acyl-CoA dehydrogenase
LGFLGGRDPRAEEHGRDLKPMRRTIFDDEHELFRQQFRRFVEKEVEPKVAGWNQTGYCDRGTWRRMGEEGYLGANAPAQFGGSEAGFLYNVIVIEELAWVRAHPLLTLLHSDIVMPYIIQHGTEEQKARYLPPTIRGEKILGICMTEPGGGSDLAAIRTTARRVGDDWVLNGSKIFITHGWSGDLFVVAARSDPAAARPHDGISLFLVEADTLGFTKNRRLEKLGLKGQDTGEIFLEDCRVPAANLLGKEGQGFKMMMAKLQQERLVVAVSAVAMCRRSLHDTSEYVKARTAFGKTIAGFQNTQFKIAEMATEIELGQSLVDRVTQAHVAGEDVVTEVSMAKWWTTELHKRVTSQCLQLWGGYGFMMETPIAGDYADAAVSTIGGGTTEIMKVIISRRLGLG